MTILWFITIVVSIAIFGFGIAGFILARKFLKLFGAIPVKFK